VACGQVPGYPAQVAALVDRTRPQVVVLEEYRIYPHRLGMHAGSTVPTLKLIGAIEYLCALRGVPVVAQGAGAAKRFVTDARLRAWGFWQPAQPHARDAIRHGCYYLLFGAS
jgi:hypothetical protein